MDNEFWNFFAWILKEIRDQYQIPKERSDQMKKYISEHIDIKKGEKKE